MTVLINGASEDATSSTVEAVGPVIVAVVGTFKSGRVRVTANIGSGEANAFSCVPGDTVRIARLEFSQGVSFKAYLEGVNEEGTLVTVEYINV